MDIPVFQCVWAVFSYPIRGIVENNLCLYILVVSGKNSANGKVFKSHPGFWDPCHAFNRKGCNADTDPGFYNLHFWCDRISDHQRLRACLCPAWRWNGWHYLGESITGKSQVAGYAWLFKSGIIWSLFWRLRQMNCGPERRKSCRNMVWNLLQWPTRTGCFSESLLLAT